MRLGKGSGNAVSQKFQRHLKAIKVARPKLVFHSIRKFINDHAMKSKMQMEPRCQVFGHEIENVNVKLYTEIYTIEEIADLLVPIQENLLATINWQVDKSNAKTD